MLQKRQPQDVKDSWRNNFIIQEGNSPDKVDFIVAQVIRACSRPKIR
jgi:hypothetical protein